MSLDKDRGLKIVATFAFTYDHRFCIFGKYIDLLFAKALVSRFISNCEIVPLIEIVISHSIEQPPNSIFKLPIEAFCFSESDLFL